MLLFDGPDARQQVKALRPPLDPQVERELIATAFAHGNTQLRLAAMRALKAHVRDAAQLTKTLGSDFMDIEADEAAVRLSRLRRDDRVLLAVALARRWPNAEAFAVMHDSELAREALHRGLHKATRTLVLSQDLPGVPNAMFDDLAWLRKQVAFDRLVIWGSPMATLPDRLIELAPFLKRLSLGVLDEMTSLPDVVCELKNLEELWIGGRKLRALHPRLSRLKKLKRLAISYTKALKEIPAEVCALTALRELTLVHSGCKLPAAIGKLRTLAKLSLIDEKARKLPGELASLPKLKEVDIRFSTFNPNTIAAVLPPNTRITHKTERSLIPLDLAWGYDRQPRAVSDS